MGGLLNALPEDMALQYAMAEEAPDPYLSVLLEMMGEELLKAATGCLPIQVRGSTALYPGCDADAQLRLINAAYHWLDAAYDTGRALKAKAEPKGELTDDTVLFQLNIHDSREQVAVTPRIARRIVEYYALVGRNDDARKVADLLEFVLLRREGADNGDIDHEAANLVIDYFLSHASELAQEEWIQEFTEKEYTSDMVLPEEYGKLGIAPGVPSCLGMSLMLSAFARLTGLPVMLVNPLSLNLDQELARKALRHTEVVEATLDIRGIEYEPLEPITEYSRYVLMKGSYADQGALVEGIESKFVIQNQRLGLARPLLSTLR